MDAENTTPTPSVEIDAEMDEETPHQQSLQTTAPPEQVLCAKFYEITIILCKLSFDC